MGHFLIWKKWLERGSSHNLSTFLVLFSGFLIRILFVFWILRDPRKNISVEQSVVSMDSQHPLHPSNNTRPPATMRPSHALPLTQQPLVSWAKEGGAAVRIGEQRGNQGALPGHRRIITTLLVGHSGRALGSGGQKRGLQGCSNEEPQKNSALSIPSRASRCVRPTKKTGSTESTRLSMSASVCDGYSR